jgi:hypothetical protein
LTSIGASEPFSGGGDADRTASDAGGDDSEDEPCDGIDRWQQDAAEALIEVARRALGDSTTTTPPVQILVLADLQLLIGLTDQGRCHVDQGPALSAEVMRRLGCEADWRLIIEDHDRNPLYVGRKCREPNVFQRAAVWSRSGGICETPGCNSPMRHIHHVLWWSRLGPTDIDVLAGVCHFHHHAIHHGHLKVESVGPHQFKFSVPDRPAFTHAETTPIAGTIEDLNEAAGLVIDDRTCASLEENAPIDLRYVVDCYAALAEQIAKRKATMPRPDAVVPGMPIQPSSSGDSRNGDGWVGGRGATPTFN